MYKRKSIRRSSYKEPKLLVKQRYAVFTMLVCYNAQGIRGACDFVQDLKKKIYLDDESVPSQESHQRNLPVQ